MVDADMYCPPTTRLTSGRPPLSSLSSDQMSEEMPPTNTDGSNDGKLAMPRTSPLVQSRQTQGARAPRDTRCGSAVSWLILRPSSHACWIFTSIVSLMSLPGSAGTAPGLGRHVAACVDLDGLLATNAL